MTPSYSVELSEDELIVLNDLVDDLAGRPDFETLVSDPADRQALHNLICLLERLNPALFADDYADRLAHARRKLLPEP